MPTASFGSSIRYGSLGASRVEHYRGAKMSNTANLTDIPSVITRYMDQHHAGNTEAAIGAFALDATVIDEGQTYNGVSEIRIWLSRTSSEYTYTSTITGHEMLEDGRIVVHRRLEGNFPGGVADLVSMFTIDGDRITRLANS